MTKVLDCVFEVGKFELLLSYYFHFRTNISGKGMNLSYPPPQLRLK